MMMPEAVFYISLLLMRQPFGYPNLTTSRGVCCGAEGNLIPYRHG